MRPSHSAWPKIRLTESGTDLITILKRILFVQNSCTQTIQVCVRSLVPRPASCTFKDIIGWVIMDHLIWFLQRLFVKSYPCSPEHKLHKMWVRRCFFELMWKRKFILSMPLLSFSDDRFHQFSIDKVNMVCTHSAGSSLSKIICIDFTLNVLSISF